MKVVICTLPYMKSSAVHPVVYPVEGNKAIEYDKPVRCPVNAVLAKTLKKGEEVRVIYILTTGENSYCEELEEIFTKELKDINLEIDAKLKFDNIKLEFFPTKRVYNKLITDLADKIPEDAELYIDITYGYKPEILSLFCAIRFVEEFHNADIEYFIYGKIETKKDTSNKGKPEKVNQMIYDITSLYYLFKLIGTIGTTDAETASKVLKDFFAL
jgi:hypothetical protein